MCVIIVLKPGYTLPLFMLENACYNNPHGYGLILRDQNTKKLQIIKSNEKALADGNDPDEIYNLLKENEDIERYLHVRWKTEGDISLENVQPFCSYNSNKREVYFMHNGTLGDYRPPTQHVRYENGIKVEESNGSQQSDSFRFNEMVLQPVLSRISGEQGKGDILDPVFATIVTKFWGSGTINKGLLVSSDQGPLLINRENWKTIKTNNGEFVASNDTYFDKLVRGPMFEKQEQEKKEAEAEERRRRFQEVDSKKNSTEIKKLKDILLQDKIKLPLNIKELLSDVDVYSDEGLASLKNLTAIEWEEFFDNNKENTVHLMIHFTDEFAKLYDKYTKASEYLKKIQSEKSQKKEQEVRVG